jgi:hypothetical protein
MVLDALGECIEALKDIPDLCAAVFRLSLVKSAQESDLCYYHVHAPGMDGKDCDINRPPW